MIGYALCGSFCTLSKSTEQLRTLVSSGYDVLPVVSENLSLTDTRFGRANEIIQKIESICGKPAIKSIAGAEPIGPIINLDLLIISPCTGNTLAKLANGITDTAVTMAAKAHLRKSRPVLIALASNDALSGNLQNLAALLTRKNIFFVPMSQDDPKGKPHSLVADFGLTLSAAESAMKGIQPQPLFLPPRSTSV